MKIRLLIDAQLIGGTETHLMNLCRSLILRHHDCSIIFIRDYPNNPLYAQCDARDLPYSKPKSYGDLVKMIRKEQPDIIHTHGYKANIIGRLLKLICKSKLVATYHSGEPPIGRLILYNFLDRWTSFLSHNIAINALIAAQLPSPADIIPNFVDMPKQVNRVKKKGPYSIYFIGRFSPEKDPISFCNLAKMESTEFNWHAVGVGPLLKEAQNIAQDRVYFHGAISNMDDIWSDVDLLCITSTHEGIPLVLLEAMSRGIPVVSFDVGSIKNIIMNEDYVIQPFGLDHMHDSIISHFSKPLKYRKEIAEQAHQQIKNHFSSALITSQIEAVYYGCNHNVQ